jgi:hypothetical protein
MTSIRIGPNETTSVVRLERLGNLAVSEMPWPSFGGQYRSSGLESGR